MLGASPAKAAPDMEPRPAPTMAVASTVLRNMDTLGSFLNRTLEGGSFRPGRTDVRPAGRFRVEPAGTGGPGPHEDRTVSATRPDPTSGGRRGGTGRGGPRAGRGGGRPPSTQKAL